MPIPPNDLTISEARTHLADLVNQAAYTGRITYVTRRGKRVAAIVPAEIGEIVERLEDEEDVAGARAATAAIAAGETPITIEALRADLDL